MFERLYGSNKDGSIQVWEIETSGNTFTVRFGKEGGKIQTKITTVEGKNVGRSNETSPEQQAVLEAESKVRSQVDKGYRQDKVDLAEKPLLPMLAMDYHKRGHNIKFPCYAQPKLDGNRCIAFKKSGKVTLLSRGGKPIKVAHIENALETLPEGVILDGELYIYGMELKDIQSAIKKANLDTPKIVFCAFDLVNETLDFYDRYLKLREILDILDHDKIEIVPVYPVNQESELDSLHDQVKDRGYEGIMLRNLDGLYTIADRSQDLQKYKKFLDSEFLIIDVVEDKNSNAVFTCKNDSNDLTFGCAFGSFDERKDQLKNKADYIGKYLTVKYQTRYGETNLPQFPVGLGVREGEVVNGEFIPSE
jgi:DNA ligase-1